MAGSMTDIRFSFLASGPRVGVLLPADFDPVPNLSSPFLNGHGGRSFDFIPAHRDVGVGEGNSLLTTLVGKEGRTVELYERLEPPPLWWLRWPLANGAVYTHLREEDGPEMAQIEADALSIIEDAPGGLPYLFADPPLVFAASSRPGYQEGASFYAPGRGAGWSVGLRRPGFLPPGRVMQLPRGDVGDEVVLRGGAKYGIEVTVTAVSDATEGQRIVSGVLGSLDEGRP